MSVDFLERLTSLQGLQGTVRLGQPKPTKPSGVPLHVQRGQAYQKKAASQSVELGGTSRRRMAPPARKVKSYEDVADYDVLQITEFSRGPFYNTSYDVIADLASPTSGMVDLPS